MGISRQRKAGSRVLITPKNSRRKYNLIPSTETLYLNLCLNDALDKKGTSRDMGDAHMFHTALINFILSKHLT